jgi:peptide/nickel transport system substrate-binding protein
MVRIPRGRHGVVGSVPAVALFTILLLSTACAPAGTPQGGSAPAARNTGETPRSGPQRVTIVIGAEVNSLATKFEGGNTYASEFHFMGNSPLVLRDPQGRATPLLAADLPSRDAGTWTVNPDGTMATTWKIRPNARWHDGQPVTTRDFVFAHRAYLDERLPFRDREPEQFMERIQPVDDTTFVIHWKRLYPWANELVSRQLEPLPEHIMGSIYEAGDPEAFFNHSFWSSTDYIGTGPFRLVQWEPGSQLIYRAFPDYFMGKPQMDEVVFRVIPDTNTVVASLLGGNADASVGITLGQRGGVTVRNQWAPAGEGEVITTPTRWRYMQIQFDPERLQQPALLDRRVRQALALSLDRATMAEIVTEGTATLAEVPIGPTDPLFARVDQAIVKHGYDPARATALLQEAGWTRRGDTLVNAAGQPLQFELRTTAQTDNETEMAIMAADMAKVGFQVNQTVVPQSRIRDSEYRVTFPGLNNTAQSIDVPGTMAVAISEQCASAERRYAGSNRGCWKNADFDRGYLIANTSLDPSEREAAIIQAFRAMSEDVGVLGLSYNTENVAVRKGLVGPGARWPGQVGTTWKIHEWRWQ